MLVLTLSPGRANPLPSFCTNPLLRNMGKTSYAMYVFHPFVYGQVVGRLFQAPWSPVREMTWPALLLEFLLAAGLTILVSWISWVAFEQPLLRLKERFRYESGGRRRKDRAANAGKALCSTQ